MNDRYPVTHDPHDPQTAHMTIKPWKPVTPGIPPPRKPSRWTALKSWAIGIPMLLLAAFGAIRTIQPDVTPASPPPLEYLTPTDRILAADYQVTVKAEGVTRRILIRQGFVSDGASIPAAARGALGLDPFHPAILRAALVHDALYRSQLVPRRTADKIFLALMIEDGAERHKAEACYRAVCAAGDSAIRAGYSDAAVLAARKLNTVEVLPE